MMMMMMMIMVVLFEQGALVFKDPRVVAVSTDFVDQLETQAPLDPKARRVISVLLEIPDRREIKVPPVPLETEDNQAQGGPTGSEDPRVRSAPQDPGAIPDRLALLGCLVTRDLLGNQDPEVVSDLVVRPGLLEHRERSVSPVNLVSRVLLATWALWGSQVPTEIQVQTDSLAQLDSRA